MSRCSSFSETYRRLQKAEKFVDPSIEEGYEIQYDKEICIEFRNVELKEGENRYIRFRILNKFGDDDNLLDVRFEIMDDSDLFYFLVSEIDETGFEKIREKDQILIEFEELPIEVEKMLEDSFSDNANTIVIFNDHNNGSGTLELMEVLNMKAVTIFSFDFDPPEMEFSIQQAQFRFSTVISELERKKKQLGELENIQKNNPVLMKTINSPRSRRRSLK